MELSHVFMNFHMLGCSTIVPHAAFALGANQVDVPLTLDGVIHALILDTIHQVYVCFIWNMHTQV